MPNRHWKRWIAVAAVLAQAQVPMPLAAEEFNADAEAAETLKFEAQSADFFRTFSDFFRARNLLHRHWIRY